MGELGDPVAPSVSRRRHAAKPVPDDAGHCGSGTSGMPGRARWVRAGAAGTGAKAAGAAMAGAEGGGWREGRRRRRRGGA